MIIMICIYDNYEIYDDDDDDDNYRRHYNQMYIIIDVTIIKCISL